MLPPRPCPLSPTALGCCLGLCGPGNCVVRFLILSTSDDNGGSSEGASTVPSVPSVSPGRPASWPGDVWFLPDNGLWRPPEGGMSHTHLQATHEGSEAKSDTDPRSGNLGLRAGAKRGILAIRTSERIF